jgi:hypothetical protein
MPSNLPRASIMKCETDLSETCHIDRAVLVYPSSFVNLPIPLFDWSAESEQAAAVSKPIAVLLFDAMTG